MSTWGLRELGGGGRLAGSVVVGVEGSGRVWCDQGLAGSTGEAGGNEFHGALSPTDQKLFLSPQTPPSSDEQI